MGEEDAAKYYARIGVIIGGWDRYAKKVGILAASLKESGLYTVIGYDAKKMMPDVDTVNKCDFFFSGGGWRDKREGHAWCIKNGLMILQDKGYNYALSVSGDALISKPGGVVSLVDVLGSDDVITCHWRDQCGTNIFFGKTASLIKAFADIPPGLPQIERKFRRALLANSIKYTIYPCSVEDQGMWGETIGFQRGNKNYTPPEFKLGINERGREVTL